MKVIFLLCWKCHHKNYLLFELTIFKLKYVTKMTFFYLNEKKVK